MKGLILYKTEGGTTKQYAEWIQEEFPEFSVDSVDTFDVSKFTKYKRIIYSSSTYRGIIIGKDYLENNWEYMREKDVFLLVVGMIPMNTAWSEKSYEAIPKEIRNDLSGYVKIPGKNPEPEKETGKFEGLLMKWFMKVDPKELENLPDVKKENLEPVFEWLRKSEE